MVGQKEERERAEADKAEEMWECGMRDTISCPRAMVIHFRDAAKGKEGFDQLSILKEVDSRNIIIPAALTTVMGARRLHSIALFAPSTFPCRHITSGSRLFISGSRIPLIFFPCPRKFLG